MKEKDLEGTLVLEKLAEIGRVDDFYDAVDSDDIERVVKLMKMAGIASSLISAVLKMIEDDYE